MKLNIQNNELVAGAMLLQKVNPDIWSSMDLEDIKDRLKYEAIKCGRETYQKFLETGKLKPSFYATGGWQITTHMWDHDPETIHIKIAINPVVMVGQYDQNEYYDINVPLSIS